MFKVYKIFIPEIWNFFCVDLHYKLLSYSHFGGRYNYLGKRNRRQLLSHQGNGMRSES